MNNEIPINIFEEVIKSRFLISGKNGVGGKLLLKRKSFTSKESVRK